MHGNHSAHSTSILPLRDAVVWAQGPYWSDFSPQLLDQRVSIAHSLEDLEYSRPNQNIAIVVLDDSDIQSNVTKLWAKSTVRHLIVVFPNPESHVVGLKSLSSRTELSNQLESFTRYGDFLAVRCVKDVQTDWSLHKLLDVITILSNDQKKREPVESDRMLREHVITHLQTLQQLIALTATDKTGMTGAEAIELNQLREQNARLQSNNASLRIQVDTLERKYNALATSRLGKITLKRWERK